jgi:hypothetical protein
MATLYAHFRDGGWGMFPTLLFGLLLLAAAGKYAVDPHRRYVPLLVALNVLTLACGALGFASGVIVTAGALDAVKEPTNISFLGVGESMNNIAFALVFVAMGALGLTLGAWKIARDPSPEHA